MTIIILMIKRIDLLVNDFKSKIMTSNDQKIKNIVKIKLEEKMISIII